MRNNSPFTKWIVPVIDIFTGNAKLTPGDSLLQWTAYCSGQLTVADSLLQRTAYSIGQLTPVDSLLQ